MGGIARLCGLMPVRVHVHDAVVVTMHVHVQAIPPDARQHLQAEQNQHDADAALEPLRMRGRQRRAEREAHAADEQQRCRMSDAPRNAAPHRIEPAARPRGKRDHRSEVVGFQRVTNAKEQAEAQEGKHSTRW